MDYISFTKRAAVFASIHHSGSDIRSDNKTIDAYPKNGHPAELLGSPVGCSLLRLENLLHSIDDGRFDLVQAAHHLFHTGSVDGLALELRLLRLGHKLGIF